MATQPETTGNRHRTTAAMRVPTRLYLAGPMCGIAEHNFPLFNRVAATLRDRGHEVFNPAENDDGGVRRPRGFYMRLDVAALLRAEAIVVLPGWQRSRGANLEVWLAIDLGLPIFACEIANGDASLTRMSDVGEFHLPFRHLSYNEPSLFNLPAK